MKKIPLIVLLFFLTGCAVGNKYNYQASSMTLPVRPVDNRTLILSVEDYRPYVLSGEKDPSFVGLQRGGYGNPFEVTTFSGKPMTEDMAIAIVRGLENAGYRVVKIQGKSEILSLKNTAIKEKATRIVVLKVYDWKSDIYMAITLHCDLRLGVFDADGKLLAENTMAFKQEIGGAHLGAERNSQIVADEFAKRIGYLFNKKEIRRALQ
jgi:hypothetical protein